jgi:elongation factor Ts
VASVSAKDVKALRDATGAGMMDCKRVLADADGDLEKAKELLRERGLAKVGKRSGRETSEGSVAIGLNGGTGALVEIGCETDFVAKTDDFQAMVSEIANAVVADASAVDADSAAKSATGSRTVADVISEIAAKVGENVQLKRVARISVDGGVVGGYVHTNGRLGVLVGLQAATSDESSVLARDVAMHVAAHDPTPVAVDRDGVDGDLVEKERELLKREAVASGKPEQVVEKIVDGRINKYYQEHCLVEQDFVKDPDQKVGDLLKASAGATVVEFVRFRMGEE